MVIDFSQLDLKERPRLILRNMDETAIGYLGHALNLTMDLNYGSMSELSFTYPAHDDGIDLKEYDLLTGLRIIDVQGYGQFILRNPEETDDGVRRSKTCSAYSLEYEFNNETITLEEGTYNFWNPVATEGTIMALILEKMPNWSVGTVSENLLGRYRTFSADGQSLYDFMVNDLQQSYDCIFDFDTYSKTINVRSTDDAVVTKPVYLSTKNLIKELQIEESTDDMVTALDVYGADTLDIRSVNPMGENRLYNLDAYMDTSYFSQEMIDAWEDWKATFEANQQIYYDTVIRMQMCVSRYATESAAMNDLKGELSTLESQKAVLLQALAIDPDNQSLQQQLAACNANIAAKQTAIETEQALLDSILSDVEAIQDELSDINDATSFSSFFTDEEVNLLKRYFKVGSLTDSTFVASDYASYASEPVSGSASSGGLSIDDTTVTLSDYSGTLFYSFQGGSVTYGDYITAELIRGTLQRNTDDSFVLSLYLGRGTVGDDASFPGGTLSMTGELTAIAGVPASASPTPVPDSDVTMTLSEYHMYFTQEATEYQKMAVAWELYEYGANTLRRLSSPTYHFSVSSADFFMLDEFWSFAQQFELGQRIYLHVDDEVLTPITTGVTVDFDDPTNFEIRFSDSYTFNDKSFALETLLDKAVSMGHSLDLNQYNYSSFVNSGAKTQVKAFMESAIDTMKNNIISGSNEQITIDGSGIRARKTNGSTYDDKQLWISNNSIMLTDDNWETAKIGIGEFADNSSGATGTIYGIAAPLLVGRILTGENLIIESGKQDGGISVFKVDAEGASLHNAEFNLYGSTGGRIELGTVVGIVGGPNKDTLLHYTNGEMDGVRASDGSCLTEVADIDYLSAGVTPNANFWIDMNGGAYFAGKIMATSGEIGGWILSANQLSSGSGTTFVALNSSASSSSNYAIWAGADSAASAPFSVKRDGTVTANNGSFGDISVSTITDPSTQTTTTTTSLTNPVYVSSGGGIRSGGYSSGGHTYYNFEVDDQGNLTLRGNLTMPANGHITWASGSAPGERDVHDLATGQYTPTIGTGETTFISGTTIYSPKIIGNRLEVWRASGTLCGLFLCDDSGNTLASIGADSYTENSSTIRTVSIAGYPGSELYLNFSDAYVIGEVHAGGASFNSDLSCKGDVVMYSGTTTYGRITASGTAQGNNRGVSLQYDSSHYIKASESGASMYVGGNQIYVNSSGVTAVGGLTINGGLTVQSGSTVTGLKVTINGVDYAVTSA